MGKGGEERHVRRREEDKMDCDGWMVWEDMPDRHAPMASGVIHIQEGQQLTSPLTVGRRRGSPAGGRGRRGGRGPG